MNEDPRDPKEQLEELMEAIKKNQSSHSAAFRLGLILHPKFGIHVLLLLIINIIVAGSLIGITDYLGFNMVDANIEGLIFMMLLFTALEIVVKLLLIRFFLKYIIMSLGLLLYIVNVLLFLSSQFLIPTFNFNLIESNIFIFTLLFTLLRLPFATYVRRAKWIQRG